jgi:hypothetical protein
MSQQAYNPLLVASGRVSTTGVLDPGSWGIVGPVTVVTPLRVYRLTLSLNFAGTLANSNQLHVNVTTLTAAGAATSRAFQTTNFAGGIEISVIDFTGALADIADSFNVQIWKIIGEG